MNTKSVASPICLASFLKAAVTRRTLIGGAAIGDDDTSDPAALQGREPLTLNRPFIQ